MTADIDKIEEHLAHAEHTVTLRVNIDNPLGIVGVAERIAMDYALILARIANHIRDELTATAGNGWAFRFIGGPGCPSLFDEAREIDANLKRKVEIKEANVMIRNDARLLRQRRPLRRTRTRHALRLRGHRPSRQSASTQ